MKSFLFVSILIIIRCRAAVDGSSQAKRDPAFCRAVIDIAWRGTMWWRIAKAVGEACLEIVILGLDPVLQV